MTAKEALLHFLSKALQRRWQDRYLSLIKTEHGRKKFIKYLCHRFEDRLDPAKSVDDLPEEILASRAFSFSQDTAFGRKEESVRTALDILGDCSLIIDKAGTHGIYKPKDMIDDIKYFRV